MQQSRVKRIASLYVRSVLMGSVSLWGLFGFLISAGAYALLAAILGVSLPVAVGVVVLVVIVAGQVGALRIAAGAERQLAALTQAEVPPGHADQLHGQLQRVFANVRAGQLADYGHAYDGEVLAAHFPDLTLTLSDWDAAVERKARARPAMGDALTTEAKRRGLPTAEYDGDGWKIVEQELIPFLAERAGAGNIGAPFRLNLTYINYSGVQGLHPDLGRELEVTLGRKAIAHLPADPAETRDTRYTAICEQVNGLVRAIADGPEATEIRDAEQHLEQKRLGLGNEILAWQRVSVLRVSVDCPTCRRNLNLPGVKAKPSRRRRGELGA